LVGLRQKVVAVDAVRTEAVSAQILCKTGNLQGISVFSGQFMVFRWCNPMKVLCFSHISLKI